jgi:serpin B
LSDAVTDEQLAQLVDSDAQFATALYQQLASGSDASLFFSPYSISTALAMVYAGARGNTAAQMEPLSGAWDDSAAWHSARNRLDAELAALPNKQYAGTPLTLSTANGLFGQRDFSFKTEFLELLAADYGAGLQTVDFSGAPAQSAQAINDWVSQRTNGRIRNILDSLDPMTRLVLANAIYFNARWMHEFDPGRTNEAFPFNVLGGGTRTVPMMFDHSSFDYAAGDGWQAVRLPYLGASMLVVVPNEGRFAEVEAGLDAAFLDSVATGLQSTDVKLGLPRWESGSKLDLVATLKQMGMTDLFDRSGADLSGIADQFLYASQALHQANVKVGEKGTEAAAATVITLEAIGAPCCPPAPIDLTIDRPFLYLIQDDAAHETLFM